MEVLKANGEPPFVVRWEVVAVWSPFSPGRTPSSVTTIAEVASDWFRLLGLIGIGGDTAEAPIGLTLLQD